MFNKILKSYENNYIFSNEFICELKQLKKEISELINLLLKKYDFSINDYSKIKKWDDEKSLIKLFDLLLQDIEKLYNFNIKSYKIHNELVKFFQNIIAKNKKYEIFYVILQRQIKSYIKKKIKFKEKLSRIDNRLKILFEDRKEKDKINGKYIKKLRKVILNLQERNILNIKKSLNVEMWYIYISPVNLYEKCKKLSTNAKKEDKPFFYEIIDFFKNEKINKLIQKKFMEKYKNFCDVKNEIIRTNSNFIINDEKLHVITMKRIFELIKIFLELVKKKDKNITKKIDSLKTILLEHFDGYKNFEAIKTYFYYSIMNNKYHLERYIKDINKKINTCILCGQEIRDYEEKICYVCEKLNEKILYKIILMKKYNNKCIICNKPAFLRCNMCLNTYICRIKCDKIHKKNNHQKNKFDI
jgi:hypothetical protein